MVFWCLKVTGFFPMNENATALKKSRGGNFSPYPSNQQTPLGDKQPRAIRWATLFFWKYALHATGWNEFPDHNRNHCPHAIGGGNLNRGRFVRIW